MFDSNYTYKPDNTSISNILRSIDNEKKNTFDIIIDSISESFNNTVKSLDNINNMPKFDVMDDELFNPEEQACINKALRDFEAQISYIKELIICLKGKKNYF